MGRRWGKGRKGGGGWNERVSGLYTRDAMTWDHRRPDVPMTQCAALVVAEHGRRVVGGCKKRV